MQHLETDPAQADTAPDAPADTKERLLRAGMEVFAERGYAAAGVREICSLAGANPAAVNYHFGDKQRFYAEVLATCHDRAAARRAMPRLADDPSRPEEALRRWILWFLQLLLVESREGRGYLGRLMMREMVNPSPALDGLVRRSFLPIKGALDDILAALLPADTDPRLHQLCFASTISQCLFYKHSEHTLAAVGRIYAEQHEMSADDDLGRVFDPGFLDLEILAEHITRFVLGGLQTVADDGASNS